MSDNYESYKWLFKVKGGRGVTIQSVEADKSKMFQKMLF